MFNLERSDNVFLFVSDNETEAVKIAAENLKNDLYATMNVTISDGSECPKIYISTGDDKYDVLPKSGDARIKEGYALYVDDNSLYITGADRRGTIYGIYTLSKMLGVSPWYYFADVPVRPRNEFSLNDGLVEADYPTIEYRGIFINDEEELEAWAKAHMNESTIGVNTYEKVFELLLRLKANYIWPAMHVNSFNMDVRNGELADRMGIVVGTSHCDMLMRSNYREWEPWIKQKHYDNAEYDYSIEGPNRDIMKEYWKESVEQNKNFEVSYTLGMRGIHDSGFVTRDLTADTEEELLEKKKQLLETVICDQKKILDETLGKETLTTFVPYKEVLNLYDAGLKVPEDVTLIWTNDNYGYIRRYPSYEEQNRIGGNGIYYHQSYWAPTYNHYLFLSSIPVAKTLYEMQKAFDNGIRKLWVVNMGAIKPLEQEMDYFLRLAFEYGKENSVTADPRLYLETFIDENFSGNNGREMALILEKYARVSHARRVENMDVDAFAVAGYSNEGALRVNVLFDLFKRSNVIYDSLPEAEKDAFFEMFLMKIHATYYTAAMFYFADRSRHLSKHGDDQLANECVELSRNYEDLRRKLIDYYNKALNNGKWDKILTPEDFPPPRTAMHPAAMPGFGKYYKKYRKNPPVGVGLEADEGNLLNCRVIKGLGRGSFNAVEIDEDGKACYEFNVSGKNDITVEIHRYPSLNSAGSIAVDMYLDDEFIGTIGSYANDEKRGEWRLNILDNVEKLRTDLGVLKKGRHTITLRYKAPYFAFYKIVIYEGEIIRNSLGALRVGDADYAFETNPTRTEFDIANQIFYSDRILNERCVPIGIYSEGINVMDKTDIYDMSMNDKHIFMPTGRINPLEYSKLGKKRFVESEGVLAIEAGAAINDSPYAYTKGGPWEYCIGVTYERTNLAVFMPEERPGADIEEAQGGLYYSFAVDGGTYSMYLLCKVNASYQAKIRIKIDGQEIPLKWNEGKFARYEAEQIFRYVPLTETVIEKGIHLLSVLPATKGIRIERILFVK